MGELSRTFATVTVVSPVGGDGVAPIPATCDLTVKPLIVQSGDVIVDERPHVLHVEEGVLRGSGEWFIPGRYAVTPDSGVARGFVVDIPAGHTEDDPFNLADAVPIDPATPLPWMPREEDVAAVAKARDEAIEAAHGAELSADAAAGYSEGAARDADRAVAAADRAEASASAAQGSMDAVVEHAEAAAFLAAESDRAAIEAGASAESARAEREALSAAIAAGDYRGEPGEPNTLSIGSVTVGTQAAATITGDAPSQTLSLVLPKAERGEPGPPGAVPTAADYMVVGPGRPDAPTTTGMTAAQLNALPVGAEYRSTDGASVGAWVWRKRPTGWAVTDGDTGARLMPPSDHAGVDTSVTECYLRRVGDVAHFWGTVAGVTGNPWGEDIAIIPPGMTGRAPHLGIVAYSKPLNGNGDERPGTVAYTAHTTHRIRLKGVEALRQYVAFSWVADGNTAWPHHLPGTPA